MIVTAKSKAFSPSQVPGRLGKSLYKKIDGSYSYKTTSNSSEVRFTVLYQIPPEVSERYNLSQDEREKVNVMDLLLSITTYSNKIRVELVELSPKEKTVAFKTFPADLFIDMPKGTSSVVSFIRSSVYKEFDGYNVLF